MADSHTLTPREFAAFLHHERYQNEYGSNTILWCIASAVNKRLDYYFHTALIKSEFVKRLLKNWSKKEVTRKAKHFSREEIFRFLKDAPDTGDWLQKKAQVIVAVYGGLRISELTYIVDRDFQDASLSLFRINIAKSKTDQAGEGHSFVVARAPPGEETCCHAILMKYLDLLEDSAMGWGNSGIRLWLKWRPNEGKFAMQPVGKNTLARLGFEVASFLGLPDPEMYTSHCFRRSMANILANAGCSKVHLMSHGRWASGAAADGYLAASDLSRTNMSAAITTGNYDPSAHRAILGPAAASASRKVPPPEKAPLEDPSLLQMLKEEEHVVKTGELKRAAAAPTTASQFLTQDDMPVALLAELNKKKPAPVAAPAPTAAPSTPTRATRPDIFSPLLVAPDAAADWGTSTPRAPAAAATTLSRDTFQAMMRNGASFSNCTFSFS